MCGTPILWGVGLLFGGASSGTASAANSATATKNPSNSAFHLADPPIVSISLEPAGTSLAEEADIPIVRPAGYILPEDGSEEAIHAGG